MKNYNWKKFALIMVVCGGIGGITGFLTASLEDENWGGLVASANKIFPYLFLVSLVIGLISLVLYFYYSSRIKQDNYSIEESSFYENHQMGLSVAIGLATCSGIINFTAFGINIGDSQKFVIIFLLNGFISFVSEVLYIALIKKLRPELNADPLNNKFKQNYFDRLDECEKHKTGKASFDTVSTMIPVYVALFCISFLLCIVFDVNTVICLPIGVLWLIQTILYTYNSIKVSKKAKEVK